MMATVHPMDDEEISIKKRRRRGFPNEMEIIDLESDSFCFTPIKDKGNSKNNAISVEGYGEEREQLRLAIKISSVSSVSNFIDLENYDDDLFVLDFEPPKTPFSKKREKQKKPLAYGYHSTITEPGESSNSKANQGRPSFTCEICVEPKQENDLFNIKGCSHAYCTDCTIKYVAAKLQDKITAISCPVENWSQTFYCPFKDCSVLLIDDGGLVVKESECPNCRRLFCAQCKVPWHADIECGEFQRLHKDEREKEDIMLMNLAKKEKWARFMLREPRAVGS
ncbi:hypothetical protein V6N13_144439 [Hibiscus sabdariffa]|uniref:RBR-type E3 ubiquitin transferase n=1 Tax=Hibiscus sabdariffa TaxID=183260 RepID=A0ABR2FKD3_9ROSI